jgi:hypothetical protein
MIKFQVINVVMSSHSDISEHQNLDHCMNSTRKLLTWSSKKQGDLQITIPEVAVECRDDAGPGFGLGDPGRCRCTAPVKLLREASDLPEERWRARGRADESRDIIGEAAELLTKAGAVHKWGAEAEI